MKKLSVRDNNAPVVVLLNTLFGTLLLSPVLVADLAAGSPYPWEGGSQATPDSH